MWALLFLMWLVGMALCILPLLHKLPMWCTIPGFIIIVVQFVLWLKVRSR